MRRVHNRALLLAIVAAVTLTAAACSSGSAAKKTSGGLTKVTIGYDDQSASSILPYLVYQSGMLRKYGIDAKMEPLGPSALTPALLGHSIDIGFPPSTSIAPAVLQGAPLVVLGVAYQGPVLAIVGKPSIKSLQDLKGKKLGASELGSASYLLAQQLVQSVGLRPNKDVTLVPSGSSSAELAALKQGSIDAAVMGEPQLSEALEMGSAMIYDEADHTQSNVGWALTVLRPYLQANNATLVKVAKALLATINFMKTDPDAAAPMLSGLFATKDVTVLKGSLETMNKVTENALQVPLSTYDSMIQAAAVASPGLKNVKASQFVDTSLVDGIVKSGFLSTLAPVPSTSPSGTQ